MVSGSSPVGRMSLRADALCCEFAERQCSGTSMSEVGGAGGSVEGGALEPPPPRSELPAAYSPHDWPPLSRLDLPPPPGVCRMACT